ncbi:MAG: 3-methyl-2-oxobutanoate hydroxymethyltransferase [Bacteriovoracaceae bacterium]|nr:3-methyl-2-oxobutanoate hydroxymethyltransferase [Bacteriovoracaceae bacterium]
MKLNTRKIKARKIHNGAKPISMLTCYDFQTAQLLNESELDLILVGDSVGNVVLGYETTVEVTLADMITFGSAVKRGAPEVFTVVDLPFGTYASLESGTKNAIKLFQQTKAEALKLEGASEEFCQLIKRCTQAGIPIMGHIGLTPQSVHQQGGYYTHGKNDSEAQRLILEAQSLEEAGCFALVLECVTPELATEITKKLNIPTIGIGSGDMTDGQVLVINDLLKMGPNRPPNFCHPVADFYELKRQGIELFLNDVKGKATPLKGNAKPLQS